MIIPAWYTFKAQCAPRQHTPKGLYPWGIHFCDLGTTQYTWTGLYLWDMYPSKKMRLFYYFYRFKIKSVLASGGPCRGGQTFEKV